MVSQQELFEKRWIRLDIKENGDTSNNRFKNILEQFGLVTSLIGLGSILQPFNITLYTYGFFILIFGTAVYFIGSIVPENTKIMKVLQRITLTLIIFIVILVLTVYLAPILVE